MNSKMVRFLKSIELDNIERFDIDFDLVSRNAFDKKQVDMLIVKKTPWNYELLDEFLTHLTNIKYPYKIIFSYVQKPTVYEAIQMFYEWHRSHNRFPSEIALNGDKDTIEFVFKSQDEEKEYESILKDYRDFLDFINYHFNFSSSIKETKDEPIVSKKQLEKIEQKAIQLTEETLKEEDGENETSYYKDAKEVVEEAQKEELKKFEDQYIKTMRANLQKLEKEHRRGITKSSWRDNRPYNLINNLADITPESGNVDINGELFGIDKPRTIKNGLLLLTMGLGKNGAAVSVKLIENEHASADDINKLKNGLYVRIRGTAELDHYTHQLVVNAKGYELLPPPSLREDKCENKRVELHLHTKMSSMDGVSSIQDYVALAKNMGHKAIAVTDHGVVQAFPEAQLAGAKEGVKILYGSELYMVNDNLPFALNPKDIKLQGATYVIFDLETTGLSARYCGITEFGAVRVVNGHVVESLDLMVNPEMPIPIAIQEKTKITDKMVMDKPTIKELLPRIKQFFGDAILVSHNINFDIGFLNEALRRNGEDKIANPLIDTLSLSRYMFPESRKHSLGALSRNLGLTSYDDDDAHRADYDARILSDVWLVMLARLTEENFELKHKDIAAFKVTTTMYKHMRPQHVTVLAKNKDGLKDLYKIISDSHIIYLADLPKTPRTELASLRKNLLIGSACFNGEVFDTAQTRSKEVLKEVISFYDYIEVQPLANYSYLVNANKVESEEEIKRIIKDIVEASDELGKMVVATGDVHYRDPSDKITRDIYISTNAVGGHPHPLLLKKMDLPSPDQHYRSTQEMLDAFEFLGKEKAYEIVVTNTNKIADEIENIVPIDNVLRQPVIEGSPEILRNTCEEKVHEMFGDNVPDFVRERMNKELNGIIGNGYSVTYYIAREIIKEANQKGFMVGSRGSVGSSFVAHLFGITEVNPLKPHYRCPKCKHYEFIDDKDVLSGYDLPDKKCPNCGENMIHDGSNIPFETFLGFNGDKVPDIDLNFPSDYQQQAFDSTKRIFGENNVFRAGTIGGVEEKTAFGYVRGYFEKHGKNPDDISSSTIAYLASRCVGVKRTTGQHPGGIVVLPKGMSIYEFTPIQYPADDKDATWFTTHLDYKKALHDTLLKLDLLGHVDPLALRLMSQMTNIDVHSIPLNDQKVLSLFSSDIALNRKGNYLKVATGALGLPEFGTDVTNDILVDAKPKSFADLVIVSGLSHGTDVWSHNAQELIKNGTCSIREVIGCRDDIMTYLIKKGLPDNVAFSIMEDVRKGKKLNPEYQEIMRAKNVPEWYLDSCNKIKYMFPKAHAVAYVTMAVRVGYFKVYHPLVFYAVWFSVRCKAYDINTMIGGLDSLIAKYDDIKRRKASREKISPKDKDLFNMLKVAIEMYERGYRFSNIDLYRSEASTFAVDEDNNTLIPPFTVIDGLGESAAITVVEARNEKAFVTKEDLARRTKLNSTNIDDLSKLGVLKGLGDTDQMSLFEFGLDDF